MVGITSNANNGGDGGNGFKSLGLSPEVYRGIVQKMGFRMPTPVQRKSLPVCLSGADTVVMARTGSGKTCAFLIPLLEKLLAAKKKAGGGVVGTRSVKAIVLSPTRELSMQTLKVLNKMLSAFEEYSVRAIGIHGGEGMEKQFHMLASRPDIIVATPGRLAHHLAEIPDFQLPDVEICVLDEADRLLEMGFAAQIRQICRSMSAGGGGRHIQKLLFSATMPKVLVEFTKSGLLIDPAMVRLDQEATVSSELRIAYVTCRSTDKDAALLHILQRIRDSYGSDDTGKSGGDSYDTNDDHRKVGKPQKQSSTSAKTGLTLIFAATRHHVEFLCALLSASGISSTSIYGSLDQEARKSNLAAFRSGHKPVLVVTDVAARGIDVPLIDHVVHYHFPSSPKLFVHRSGRAARAGRIGYCWGLVEPDELPYMVDLHVFLGRKLRTSCDESTETSFTLNEMTPDMVYYGSVPESIVTAEVENVQRLMNPELSGSMEAETLRALTRVCRNAMKQYRKTRTEPSREGIRRAKAILEGERLETGQRVGGGGSIPPHPLLIGTERQRQQSNTGLGNLENTLAREEFLRAMSNFRPKETVFEAFSTGAVKEAGVVSQVDKGRTTTAKKKNDSSASLKAMKNMRRQMRMARDKGSTLVVAGTGAAVVGAVGETLLQMEHDQGDGNDSTEDGFQPGASVDKLKEPHLALHAKPRLSRAERRRRKKNPCSSAPLPPPITNGSKSVKRQSDFRDPAFFIENDFTSNTEEAQRSRQIEAAMQPNSASSGAGKGSLVAAAHRIEEAMLDIVGDEGDDLVKKQRMMRWDKSKRKYVATTVGAELSGDSKSKRTRLESGQIVKSDKLKLGALYEKWQKKTNRSVGRSGVFDDDDNNNDSYGSGRVGGDAVSRKGKKKNGRGGGSGAPASRTKGDEIKTAGAIKKERERQQNLKMKNMKRNERRSIEGKQRDQKARFARKQQR